MPNAAQVGLNATGVVSYGGYVFTGAYHLNVRSEDIYDESQRIILYVKHIITVKAIIADAASANVEFTMDQLRTFLEAPGSTLIITQKGLMDSASGINTSLSKDVNFGPKPRVISWRQVGSYNAVEIVWECEACLVKCGGANGKYSTGILALNFDISVSVDTTGITTRSVNGYMQVANALTGQSIINNPELLLPRFFSAPRMARFKRSSTRKFNAARNILEFTIADVDIDSNNPYNEFVTDISGTQSLHWGIDAAGQQFNSLNIRMNTRADVQPSQAWLIALDVYIQRVAAAFKSVGVNGVNGRPFLLSIDVTEDIWARTSEFTFKWMVLAPVTDLIAWSGLWVPLKTTNKQKLGAWDWTDWGNSMVNSWQINGVNGGPNTIYGNAGWVLKNSDNIVVTMCFDEIKPQLNGTVTFPPKIDIKTYSYTNPKPPPENSYKEYYMDLTVKSYRQTAIQNIIQKPEIAGGDSTMLGESTGAILTNQSGTVGLLKSIIQQYASSYELRLTGRAQRVGTPINKPMLLKVGGQDPIEIECTFKNSTPIDVLGQLLYSAEWDIRYTIQSNPSVATALANPATGVTLNNGYTLTSGTLQGTQPTDGNPIPGSP